MANERLDSTWFRQFIQVGGAYLTARTNEINDLNVFPVPDGDTGTNMSMTWDAAMEELAKTNSNHLGELAKAVSRGLLHGARGNSGVILSQLFRGFCKYIESMESVSLVDFASAMQYGVDMAYRVMQRPKEGTILTVAKESARTATVMALKASDFAEFFGHVIRKAAETLEKTPDMLPVLKQAGVVDAGGKGLLVIYESMLAAILGETVESAPQATAKSMSAQAHFHTEDIEHGYCTEFLIRLDAEKLKMNPFDENQFRDKLEQYGDSLLVIVDEPFVKVHIHAERPGDVLNEGGQYGALERIKIDNMRVQHEQITGHTNASPVVSQRYAVIAVAAGEGMEKLFRDAGATAIVSGGQSMNPSAQDFITVCERIHAETIFILPNNSNVILAAQQAAQLSDRPIVVIPSKTMQQGIAALIAFHTDKALAENEQAMTDSLTNVESGHITIAVRDSEWNGMEIRENDFIGLHNNQLVSSAPDLLTAVQLLCEQMITAHHFMITVYAGADADEQESARIQEWLSTQYPDLELEWYIGAQPVYHYLLSVE